jgi:Uri superfamily endonuclease
VTDGGTYTLLVALPDPATVEVGALGALELQPGWYAYVGSALGSGGFARIDRHRDLAAGDRDTRHWHVDSLLGHPDSRLDSVVRSAGVDAECTIAGDVDGDRIEGFGCSDCSCDSHLRYRPERAPLLASVEDAHERARAAADASG